MKGQPAFRKWTPAVARGIRYAVAALEFDAEHGEADLDGKRDDLRAAAAWLRHQHQQREGTEV